MVSKKLTVKLWGKGVVEKNTIYRGSEATQYYTRFSGQFIYGKLDFLNQAFGIIPEELDGYESTLDSPAFDVSPALNKDFFLDYVSREQFYLVQGIIANGSRKAKRIHSDTFFEMPILLPEFNEQKTISDFTSKFDTLISLHQRKLDNIKMLKKSLLQKLFPKDGEKIPELRFPGFTDAWEQRKLGEIARIIGGGTPSTSNPEYWDGGIDWYSPAEIGSQIYVSKSVRQISDLGLQKSSAKLLPEGSVLFTSRAGIGNTAILAKESCTNQGFQSIVPNKGMLDTYFIFSQSHALKKYGETVGAGSTFVEVSGKQMERMDISLPIIQEQEKIGAYFKQMDSLLSLHQRKLDHLKELKKGLLQQMFV